MADVSGQIRQLSNRVTSLTNYLNGCIRRAGEARAKERKLKKRLHELESIRSKAGSGLSEYSDSTASKERSTALSIRDAVKKHAHTEEIINTISRAYEPSFPQDSNGWECIANIDREIARVQQELDEAKRAAEREENNARNTRTSIANTNSSIRKLQTQAANG